MKTELGIQTLSRVSRSANGVVDHFRYKTLLGCMEDEHCSLFLRLPLVELTMFYLLKGLAFF